MTEVQSSKPEIHFHAKSGEPDSGSSGPLRRYRVFAHLQADKAALYRAILQVFSVEKERFMISLRPGEVRERLGPHLQIHCLPVPATEELEPALRQLVDWGNLEASPDHADVATVEEFYRPRFLFQLSAAGEAAEFALAQFHEHLEKPGELQTAALHEILELLEGMRPLVQPADLDEPKVHQALRSLFERFAQLTSRAQSFMREVRRASDLHGFSVDDFLIYKDKLIEYLDRFIGELVVATNRIVHVILALEQQNMERVFAAAARRELVDALDATQERVQEAEQGWRARWQGLRRWFIGENGSSQAELLRARARAAIPALLATLSNINDRRTRRTDRAADFLALARGFAAAPNDDAAHRLWRAAFGLSPSRHLRVNRETLDTRDKNPESSRTSWLQAEPLWIAPRLRQSGRTANRGPARSVIDRSEEKALLQRLAHEEALQIEHARERLAGLGRSRLGELGVLDAHAFQLFLDLLGEALTEKRDPDDPVETMSADGALRIRMEPTPDGATATLHTEHGTFHGRDHWITIERAVPAAA